MTASTSKVPAYPSPPIRNPAIMGPAASPMSQIVPKTPMAAPRRRAEARSAMSALVTGVTAAIPRPRSGATMRCHNDKGYEVFAPEDQRKRSGAEEEADDDDRLSSQSIGEPSAYRLRNHCGRELAAQDNRDLGVVEPDRLGVDRQEAEEGAVAEIHHGFDAGRDEDRRRGDDLCETLTELGHPGAQCGRLTLRGAIDIGQPQHDEKRQHPDSPDQKVG